MRPTRTVAAAAAALVLLAGCGKSPTPYSSSELRDAKSKCENANAIGGVDILQCLRERLPKMSDDQLNRLDYYIDQQEQHER